MTAGQRGGQHRPQRRRRDQVFTGERGAPIVRGGADRGPALEDRFGVGTRDHVCAVGGRHREW